MAVRKIKATKGDKTHTDKISVIAKLIGCSARNLSNHYNSNKKIIAINDWVVDLRVDN